MYTIEREPGKIVIRDFKGTAVYTAGPGALIAFRNRKSDDLQVAKVADLNDTNLLIALINSVEIKNLVGGSGPAEPIVAPESDTIED